VLVAIAVIEERDIGISSYLIQVIGRSKHAKPLDIIPQLETKDLNIGIDLYTILHHNLPEQTSVPTFVHYVSSSEHRLFDMCDITAHRTTTYLLSPYQASRCQIDRAPPLG
jgi:hypothetical protein